MQIKTVRTSGTIPHTPVIEPLSIDQNGTYTAPTGVDGYSPITVNVAEKEPVFSGATIYDYDGTVIETYTPEEFAALSAYPTHPTHEYLTPNGYNVALATAQAYAAKYGYVEVGAQYYTVDRKTRLFITLEDFTLNFRLGLGVNGSVDVDWGDGSAHGTMTGSNINTLVQLGHVYSTGGNYVITLTVTGTAAITGDLTPDFISKISNSGESRQDFFACVPYINSLTKLFIGDNISLIDRPFFRYTRLEYVLIPDNIDMTNGDGTFDECNSLKAIIVPNGITELPEYFVNQSECIETLVLPHTLLSIPKRMATACYSLKSIVIPDRVTSIDDAALCNCSRLKQVILSDNITSIGTTAFAFCYNLEQIKLPDKCTTYGRAIFSTTPIVHLEIPAAATSIVSLAVMCALETLKFKSSIPPTITGSDPWDDFPIDCIIYVPSGSLSAYTSASNYPDPNTYTYVEY